jgi:hypothetical protein
MLKRVVLSFVAIAMFAVQGRHDDCGRSAERQHPQQRKRAGAHTITWHKQSDGRELP